GGGGGGDGKGEGGGGGLCLAIRGQFAGGGSGRGYLGGGDARTCRVCHGARPQAAGRSGAVASVSLEGVSKRFKATRAVESISLTVADGEFFALLGPSGCGKTTLLRLGAGVAAPDARLVRLAHASVGPPGFR